MDGESIDGIKASIRRVLDSLNWKYLNDDDVGAREVVCIFGAGDMGNWVLINRIIPQKKVLLIMATCQENVPEGTQRSEAVEFVSRANFGILNGFFDMDLSDGDLRFSSRVEYSFMDKKQFETNFRRTFQIVHGTFSKYLPGVDGVTRKNMSGRNAVELVEGGANTVPDGSPLLAAVARHLQSTNTNYVCHSEKSIIRMPCTVQGVTYHLRIKAMEEPEYLYVFCNYPRHGGKVPIDKVPDMVNYITRANWALPFGYFDLDTSDGELRFVTWLPAKGIATNVVQTQYIRALVVSAITTFVKYLPGMDELVNKDTPPAEAIAMIERTDANADGNTPSVEDIIESVMMYSDPEDSEEEVNVAAQHYPVSLPYSVEELTNGTNGLVYFLGTKGKTTEYQNPCETSFIEVTSSGLASESDPITCILDKSTARCITKSQESPWIMINFLRSRVRPTHYMLQHYSATDTEALRSWKLEGSVNGVSWNLLSDQTNDENLNSKNSRFSWPIETTKTFYSHFKLTLTGPNSNNRYHLALGGIEFYGSALVDFPVEPQYVSSALDDDTAHGNSDERSGASVKLSSKEVWINYDDIELHSEIRKDSHGTIWKGTFSGMDCTVKIISKARQSSQTITAFPKFLMSAYALSHRHISPLLGAVDDRANNQWIVVTPWYPLGSLSSVLSSPKLKSKLNYGMRLQLAIGISKGLQFLHSNNILHMDLTPNSVMITTNFQAKLVDFGFTKQIAQQLDAQCEIPIAYCAPEVLRGEPYTQASDVYALGILIYELLTQRRPYHERRIPLAALCSRIANSQLRPSFTIDVLPKLQELLKSTWSDDPSIRPSARDVIASLQEDTQ